MANLTFSSYIMQTTMYYDDKWGNKGLNQVTTGTYEFYIKTEGDSKTVKEEATNEGPRIIVAYTSANPREKQLTGYLKTLGGANATTIEKLHTASLALSTRPFPCINNIFLPSMILTVTAGSDLFPEFANGTKWMVDKYSIIRSPDKGYHNYEISLTLLQYFGNLE